MPNVLNAGAAASLLLLAASAGGPPAHGGERHVLVTNNTREPIIEIHVADTGPGDWQGDLLGSDILPPGQSILVEIDDRNGRCRVDIKTVLDDGSELVSRRVNICRSADEAVSLR